jgi:O-antigen ligase
VYVAVFVAGYFLDQPALNILGGLAMIYFAVIGNHRSMFHVTRDAPTRWAFAIVAAIFVSWVIHPDASETGGIALKYALIFVLFVRIRASGLRPLTSSRSRLALLAICTLLIVVSLVSGRAFLLGDERRLSGIFHNPNNLALMALGLLLLVDERDRPLHQVLVHLVVIGCLVVTYTSGAILAFAVGLVFRYRRRLLRPQGIAVVVLLVTALAITGGVSAPERIKRQVEIVQQNLDLALASDVEYGSLVEEYGDSATSGLWRIAMWSTVLRGYAAASPTEWLFGGGLGSSPERYGNHPHNEYVRLLAETGVLGLVAFLGFFFAVFRALRPEDRHLPLVFLLYSVTENNLDNFVFMTLFALFLGGAIQTRSAAAASRRAGEGTWALRTLTARPVVTGGVVR